MREDAPQLLCVHLFTKKNKRGKQKMGDRSSSQDMVKAEAPFCRQSKIGHQLLLFLLPTYRWGKRLFTISDLAATSFFQDWMARKTGSILDKEHVNYFFYSLSLSLFPFQTVTGLAPSFFSLPLSFYVSPELNWLMKRRITRSECSRLLLLLRSRFN